VDVVVGPLSVTSAIPFPGATLGASYSRALTATGGVKPYAWSISTGALPAGLTLNAATGVISGTPTGAGSFAFTVQVTDSQGTTATKDVSLDVVIGPLVITTADPLASATAAFSYSRTLTATGGGKPFQWTIDSGSLPAGLTLTASTGVISGKPATSGSFSVVVRVTDSFGTATTKAFTLAVQ
jgi:hypothetical protein